MRAPTAAPVPADEPPAIRRIIGVAHPGLRAGLECGVVAGDAEGELMHVGLADDDGACRAQFCRHWRVLLRDEALQSRRSRAGGKPGHLDIVLDDDGDAAERLARTLLAAGVEGFGGLHRASLVERDEGVELGPCLGTRQRRRCQRLAGDLAGAEIGSGLRRGELIQVDRRLGCRGGRRGEDKARKGRAEQE